MDPCPDTASQDESEARVYCGQCGTANPEDAGSCETCGAPLLVSAGSQPCATCGGTVGDLDRFCTVCGSAVEAEVAGGDYEVSDDFGDLDIDEIQIEELPDWLQGMAPSTTAAQANPPASEQPTPDDLPDWLRESPSDQSSGQPRTSPSPSVSASGQGSVDHQPADQFSLVSDEDLPEWLRALSDDDDASERPSTSEAGSSPSRGSAPSRSTAVANLFDVPPISRAWLTHGRTVDQSQVAAAREEFLPLHVVSALRGDEDGAGAIWEAEPVHSGINEDETRPFTVADEDEPAGAGRGKLIARLVILGLIVVVALLLVYVLIQGI